jgi:hypothetical protein
MTSPFCVIGEPISAPLLVRDHLTVTQLTDICTPLCAVRCHHPLTPALTQDIRSVHYASPLSLFVTTPTLSLSLLSDERPTNEQQESTRAPGPTLP